MRWEHVPRLALSVQGAAKAGAFSSSMILDVVRAYEEPEHREFKPRNAWSLYNSVNQALKTSPVNEIMERHRALHANILNLT